MNPITISHASRQFGISTRTLRYYEQIGLVESVRDESSAYRAYDEAALKRIGQIVLLRKLRLPLKRIAEILKSDDAAAAIEAFQQSARELSAQIEGLTAIRAATLQLIERLNQTLDAKLSYQLLGDESIAQLLRALPTPCATLKEEGFMEKLDQANQQLSNLTDVRLVFLPPAAVAASHFIGDEPERCAGDELMRFIRAKNLKALKPGLRMYGFNHPNPVDETGAHGYEFWVTIPEDMDVPAPLEKKHFKGGLYAAHMIKMGDFHEWEWFMRWIHESEEYEFNGEPTGEHMYGLLEEHLNLYNHIDEGDEGFVQLDLLIPIRGKVVGA